MIYSVFILSMLGLIYLDYRRRVSKVVVQWKRCMNLYAHKAVFDSLYENVNGFELSKQARRDKDALEYVYGEIDFETFIALLSGMHPNTETVFYDLGCGLGKAVLACAMVFDVKKSYGIELFPSLYKVAQRQSTRLLELPGYTTKAKTIEFLQGDFMEYFFTDATLVFINATAFMGEYWKNISYKMEELAQNALVITTSKKLQSAQFIFLRSTKIKVSWGIVTVYVQQRR